MLDLDAAPVATAEPDDSVVSDILYEALKLYEHNSLEEAFQKCRQALGVNPASTSARSLLALVYEKKSADMTLSGDIDDARDYLSAAIRQLELVLEANPESEADRDKLNDLRTRIVDGPVLKKPVATVNVIGPALAWLGKLPPLAISIATVAVVFLLVLLIFRPHGGNARTSQIPSQQPPGPRFATAQPQVYPSPGAGSFGYRPPSTQPQPLQQPQGQGNETYPQQQMAPQAGYPAQPGRTNVPALPNTPPPTVTPLNPLPAGAQVPPPLAEKPKVEKPTAQVQPAAKTASLEDARQAYARQDYSQAAAIFQDAISSGDDTADNNQMLGQCYYNMGRGPEAISRFERAIQIYSDRKARGESSAAADQGIRTCKKFIQLARE